MCGEVTPKSVMAVQHCFQYVSTIIFSSNEEGKKSTYGRAEFKRKSKKKGKLKKKQKEEVTVDNIHVHTHLATTQSSFVTDTFYEPFEEHLVDDWAGGALVCSLLLFIFFFSFSHVFFLIGGGGRRDDTRTKSRFLFKHNLLQTMLRSAPFCFFSIGVMIMMMWTKKKKDESLFFAFHLPVSFVRSQGCVGKAVGEEEKGETTTLCLKRVVREHTLTHTGQQQQKPSERGKHRNSKRKQSRTTHTNKQTNRKRLHTSSSLFFSSSLTYVSASVNAAALRP